MIDITWLAVRVENESGRHAHDAPFPCQPGVTAGIYFDDLEAAAKARLEPFNRRPLYRFARQTAWRGKVDQHR